jgi:amidase
MPRGDGARLERRVRVHARLGRLARRAGMLKAAPVDRLRARVLEFFRDYDLLLTPTLAQPGPLAENWRERGWWANMVSNVRYAPYPSTWNLLGWPAASVPAGWHASASVPLAVQIVAAPQPDGQGEALILSLAAQLERLRPWPRIAPGFSE